MQVLLPDIMETLRHANTDVKMKSLVFFRNMMGHVKRKEASLIALQLAEKLLPLFDDESSQLREISIRLFKDVMKTVVGRQKKKMAKKVQSVLLPLFLHRNDQIKSVAKASRDTFVACTEFLGWRMANYMPEPYHTHLIGEFLLAHDRSRVEEYLCQSLPYLEDTQASMREAAVRFIDGTLPEQENPEHPDLQAGRDADSTRLPPSLDSSDVMLVFEESLQPSQATDTVLVATEGPTADDFYARQMGSNVLDMAVRDPESWLMDARKMQVLLPDIMETLRHANTDVKMKSLVFFRNMMGHVKRKEASLIALQLAEKLLPLFDDESSQLREISIRLFKDVMKTVVGRQKKKMAKKVQSVLLPLFLHRNDQIKSVAKASRDTFVACTEFLGWRMANYMPEPYHTHLIGEFLLAHDRSRVEEYLCQSLPYLEDTQASMREAAVRFIDGTLPEQENPEHPDLQAGRDADSTRLPPSLDSSDVMLVFEESLQPSQATDTVLVATEGPTADDFYARQMGSNVLDMAVRDPESWLMDARKMQVLLPDIMETLRHANTDVKMKSLVFFRNMMGHVKRKEASLIALQLAEKLLPLFDDESSQLREISIRLFKDVMKTVVGRQKKKMAKKVQSVLLPLFLHRNDQIKSVAKASRDTFVACTEFLGWRMANYMPEPYHTHLIGEFLLAHDRSRVEEYVCQSLPYLEDTQASMREAAVRFIDGTLPEQENPEHPDLQAGRDADSTRLPPSLDSSDVMLVFEESLQPSQATDTVLVATEGPTADDFYARQMGSNVLDMAVRDPESWLMDARKMQVLLPDIMETLRHANTDVKMKSLVFFRNMMGHVKRKEASLIALQLAEKLLPLFDDESSQLREISIRLFKDVMKTVVGRQKKKMAKKVQSVLLPLFLHRNDQIKSVAKASRDTFVACTEFLGWRMANYMPEPYHTHLIGEFLLAHDRSRVEEYLCQSLPYLEDTQASMREAAVRFIDGTLPEQENPEHPDLQAGRDADSTRLPPSLDSSDVMLVFEESLQPSQATDTVLVATEGPTADDFYARQMGSNVLDMAVRDPESWLMDARKMQVLLPDIMETLRHANTDVKMKSLVFFRNMMGHVKRKEASLIALQLAEKLLPLFDDESSQLREISIRLFKDVMKTVVGRQKKKMAKKVQSVLLPLFLHRNDQIKSVAKVQ
ncbi:unnamed protein product [Bubo scandiacus]